MSPLGEPPRSTIAAGIYGLLNPIPFGCFVAALIFVHSRDAYAVVPAGVWLSACTVVLMSIGHIVTAVERTTRRGYVHE